MSSRLMLSAALPLVLLACSPAVNTAAPTVPETKPADAMAGMDMTTAPPASPEVAAIISGAGKVAAVDPKAGTVKLDHGPIAALNWPAMAMTFTAADPATLQDLKVGDEVSFEIKSAAESSVITKVEKK